MKARAKQMGFTKVRMLLTVALLVGFMIGFLRFGYSEHFITIVFVAIGVVQFFTAALLALRRIKPSNWGYSPAGSALLGLGCLSIAATAYFGETQADSVQWLFIWLTFLLFCLGLHVERVARLRDSIP